MSETLSLAFAFAWLFAVPSAHSQDVAPDVLVKSLSSEVIAEVRRDKAIQAGDGAKIAALIETKVVPHFDLRRITQLAVGHGWRRVKASSCSRNVPTPAAPCMKPVCATRSPGETRFSA